jgi:hypothetical protein
MASKRTHDGANQRKPGAMSNPERQLDNQMLGLEAELEHARQLIETNSRSEHWGKAPERDWSWRSPGRQ